MKRKRKRNTKDNSELNLDKYSKLIPLMAPIKWTPISIPFTLYLDPAYSNSGRGYVTCFHQRDNSRLGAKRDLNKL